ncbi:Hsp20 family protein, partial [Brachyspira hampsonii]
NISTKGIDVENIAANLNNGVLMVTLPKKEELKYEKKIEIKGE